MKRASILAKRYAKALFLLGREHELLDTLQSNLSLFSQTLTEYEDFYHFILSPEVTRREKENKILELFGESFSKYFYSFIQIVLYKGRQDLFLEIASAFESELDIFQRRVQAVVTSAVTLTPELQREIQQQLAARIGKEVILIPEVDETLLGGIRIMVDGKVIDGSIKGQLQKMRQFLRERSAETLNLWQDKATVLV